MTLFVAPGWVVSTPNRSLEITTDLQPHIGANAHFNWGPTGPNGAYPNGTWYCQVLGVPYAPTVNQMKALNFGVVREFISPQNSTYTAAFTTGGLTKVQMYGTPALMSSSHSDVVNAITEAGAAPYANRIGAICGPNEPNGGGGSTWPGKVLTIMDWINEGIADVLSANGGKWPGGVTPAVVGPALMHNVTKTVGGHKVSRLDDDYAAMGAAVGSGGQKLWQKCNQGDFHWYSGVRGPGYRMNGLNDYGSLPAGLVLGSDGLVSQWKFELQRARVMMTGAPNATTFPFNQSEFGWTNAHFTGVDGPPYNFTEAQWQAYWASLTAETFLRQYNEGLNFGIFYEAVNEEPYATGGGSENWFGLFDVAGGDKGADSQGNKAGFYTVKKLTHYSGNQSFAAIGYLQSLDGVNPPDYGCNVFSNGDNTWDMYLLREAQPVAHIVLDPAYQVQGYTLNAGGYYEVPFTSSILIVTVEPSDTPPVWRQQNPPNGTESVSYGPYQFVAEGATTYTVVDGVGTGLPAGITLSLGGSLSGTATVSGKFTFQVAAVNSAGTSLSNLITIQFFAAPVFTADTPPNGSNGASYRYVFKCSGWPSATFTVGSGSLPPGLTLSANGKLTGTPSLNGTYMFVVHADNGHGTADTGTLTVTISGGGGGGTAPTFTVPPPFPPSSVVTGDSLDFFFEATGSPSPVFSVYSGTLPNGISLTSDGEMSGNYTLAGSYSYVVQANNGVLPPAFTSLISVTVTDPIVPPTFTADNPPSALLSTSYSYQFVATGTSPITYALGTGSFPPGLTLNSSTGVLSGTPTTVGVYTFTITATNVGEPVYTPSITLDVNEAPVFTADSPPAGQVGVTYGYQFAAAGFPAPIFSINSGSIPPGTALTSDGRLAGVPTGSGGTYMFTVEASNGVGSPAITGTLTVVIASGGGGSTAPVFTAESPSDGAVGVSYHYLFTASGTPDPTFTVGSGFLPLGLVLALDGTLSGTPTTPGTYLFTVVADNGVSPAAETPVLVVTITGGGGPGGSPNVLITNALIEIGQPLGLNIFPYFDGNFLPDALWETGELAGSARSYLYQNRAQRREALIRLLQNNVPMGIGIGDPQFAVLPMSDDTVGMFEPYGSGLYGFGVYGG